MKFSAFDFELPLTKRNLLFITIGSWLCLGILIWMIQKISINGPDLFNETETYLFSHYLQEIGIYLLASFIIFILPGLIWINVFFNRKYTTLELLAVSFIASLTGLIVMTTMFKMATPKELQFLNFISMLLTLTFTGLMMCLKKDILINTIKISLAHILLCFLLIFLIVVVGWVFQEEILRVDYDRNFSPERILDIPLGMQDDVLESFGLMNSLKTYLLPYWDLEYADRFGYSIIDPPLRIFISLFLMLFLGESFAVQSLNTLLVLLLSFWLVAHLATLEMKRTNRFFFVLVIPFLFLDYLFVFLEHHESSLVLIDHIHFMSLFVMAQFYFLLMGRHNLFLIFALLAFLTKFEAVLFTLLGLWFYQKICKPQPQTISDLFRKYLMLISPYILLMIMIGMLRRDLGAYLEAFFLERFVRMDHFHLFDKVFPHESTAPWGSFSMKATWEFFKQFMLGSSFLGIVIFFPQKDKISCFFNRMTIFYFILVMISREKRVHYISPLVLMSSIVALRMLFLTKWKEHFLPYVYRLAERMGAFPQKLKKVIHEEKNMRE